MHACIIQVLLTHKLHMDYDNIQSMPHNIIIRQTRLSLIPLDLNQKEIALEVSLEIMITLSKLN